MNRNFSINRYFDRIGATHRPRYRFAGTTQQQFEAWQSQLLPKVLATLGRMPPKVSLNPQIEKEWRQDGLIKQRIVFDVEEDLSVAALLFRPDNARGRLPAILACHGHSPGAKHSSMGLEPGEMHNAYGLRMAQAGFVTIGIDWRGFGERNDNYSGQRDLCNLHYLRASILGMTVLGMDLHDGMCAIDYLCQQEFVDPQRIGVMGLSFGGTMATWLALCDRRIRAVNVICYSVLFAEYGLHEINFCGSQITPGIFELCDVPDVQGLIAPRPLLIEIGTQDRCFNLDMSMRAFGEVQKIYAAAGARDRLELDCFQGNHRWGGNKSVEFFRRWLGQAG